MAFSIFRRIKRRYRHLYRFVIMDDATYEEKVVFRLTPRLFMTLSVTIIVLLIVLTSVLVAFTPLREYIPGYGSERNKQKMMLLQTKSDSLFRVIAEIAAYEQSVKNVFTDGVFREDSIDLNQKTEISPHKNKFAFSEYDSILMQAEVKKTTRSKNIPTHIKPKKQKQRDLFFAPVHGIVQQKYTEDFKGVKISCVKGTSVFTPLAGTVVRVGYGLETGAYIILLHPDNIITIYQHAGNPTVQTGDYVSPNQLISTINTDMPLAFELWINGSFVNPEEYILF